MDRSFQGYHEQRFKRRDKPLPHEDLPGELEPDNDVLRYQGMPMERYLEVLEARQGTEIAEAFRVVCRMAREVKTHQARALIVGGAVRDEVLGKPSKDFDVEVYGISMERLDLICRQFGAVNEVGRNFGILKLRLDSGFEVDVSVPRRDSKTGTGKGHRDITAKVDSRMTVREAAQRRDFTFNALAKDPLTGVIYDPFGGVQDLSNRILRATDRELFRDDALRVLRGAQFVARFGLMVEDGTRDLMRTMVEEMKELSAERFLAEWDKLLMKSDRPSAGLQALHEFGVIDGLYPELAALRETPQEFDWHPEGDVWVHTLMVVDEAARVARRYGIEQESPQHRRLMYAALCHDLGKSSTTVFEEGRVRSRGHEAQGDSPSRALLSRIGFPKDEVDAVVQLVMNHLWPGNTYRAFQAGERVTEGAFRRVARRIAPATIEELTWLMEADSGGRGPFLHPDFPDQLLLPFPDRAGSWAREQAKAFGVDKSKPASVIQGRDLITGFRLKPGVDFGTIISLADELRDGGKTREEILLALDGSARTKDAIQRLTDLLEQVKQSSDKE